MPPWDEAWQVHLHLFRKASVAAFWCAPARCATTPAAAAAAIAAAATATLAAARSAFSPTPLAVLGHEPSISAQWGRPLHMPFG